MPCEFTKRDIQKIARTLNVAPKRLQDCIRFEIGMQKAQRILALEIYPDLKIGTKKGHLISVYTRTSHLQLHFCTGYIVSNLLGEVTFVSESNGTISGLTIEREGGCSLYANVDRSILSGNFTTLGPEIMLSSVALSLTEQVLPPPERSTKKKRQRSKKAQ
ncbi:MAG: hypothetical protein N3A63_07610 [Bacteroidetes bacterium]|nr:hypothetical protein [Bacteroidota bacterium]